MCRHYVNTTFYPNCDILWLYVMANFFAPLQGKKSKGNVLKSKGSLIF